MTTKQELKVRRNAYKFYDEVIYEHTDWSKLEITNASFCAGAEYALKNKSELKDDAKKKEKPNIVQFLKDNGACEMFFKNLLDRKQEEDLIDYLSFKFFTSIAISAAFIWHNTPEGQEFWGDLSDKWAKQF